MNRLVVGFAFLSCEGEQYFASPAGADLKVRDAILINIGRKQQFNGIIPNNAAIGELYERDAVIKDFKRRFLALSFKHMAQYENRLTFPLSPEILERVLR